VTANVRSDLSAAGRITTDCENALKNIADRIGWHSKGGSSPGLGAPGDTEMQVSPDARSAARAQEVPVSPVLPPLPAVVENATPAKQGSSVRALSDDQEQQFDSALRAIETYMPHPSNAKVTIQPVRKWTVRVNSWRDLNTFLKDCCAYAAAARQEILAVVTTSMDDTMRLGYESVLQAVVRDEPSVWHVCVRAFLIVTGRDIRNP